MKIRDYCVDSTNTFLWEGVKEKGSIEYDFAKYFLYWGQLLLLEINNVI